MRIPDLYPLSKWRPDVLVSTGVSDRFSESDIRQALQAHGSLRSTEPTRVQVRHLGSVIIASDPRRRQTVVLRPDEFRAIEKARRS